MENKTPEMSDVLNGLAKLKNALEHINGVQESIAKTREILNIFHDEFEEALKLMLRGFSVSESDLNYIDRVVSMIGTTGSSEKPVPAPIEYAKQFYDELKYRDIVKTDEQLGLRICVITTKTISMATAQVKPDSWADKYSSYVDKSLSTIWSDLENGVNYDKIRATIYDCFPEETFGLLMYYDFVYSAVTDYMDNRVTLLDNGFAMHTTLEDELEAHQDEVNDFLTKYVTGEIGYNTCFKSIAECIKCSHLDARRIMYIIL